ncbi:MmoB/DmpM family protein [Sporichthya sp.]|uniref:MmoB/DmpM family protein n=1 Tax=Sporichthya sp. TaxID=65475 RepID=UPI001848D21C|nr:MmoB/DmpM family protein [Sporichthya sp.]MBA3742191.1 MmoB/DmpM family protein [Sporichthya sp.]
MTVEATPRPMVGIELMPGPEADAVLEAALEAQDNLVVTTTNPAVLIISAPGRLEIDPAVVREHLGREDWTGPDIQVIMASYFGMITQLDDERIVLEWLRKGA